MVLSRGAVHIILRRRSRVHDLVTQNENVLVPHDFLPLFRFTHVKHIQHGDSYKIYPPTFLFRDEKRWVPMTFCRRLDS